MQDKKSPIFIQIEHFQSLKFEFTNGFEMMHKVWCNKDEVPYCFSRSFIKFQGHTGWLIDDFNTINLSKITRPVAAIKSLRFALWWHCLKKWQIAIKCYGKSMMTDNYSNMKEILKLLILNYIISDYLWSYGDHSLSTFIYLFFFVYLFVCVFFFLFICLFIHLFIYLMYLSICLSIYLFDT